MAASTKKKKTAKRRATKRAAKPKRAAKRGSKAIRILVVRAPGTNCDQETGYAFEREGATIKHVHINALLDNPKELTRAHGLVIPGGFSYGDDLGAGTVLGTAMRTKLLDPIRSMVDRGGIALGICNGFQVLVKTGLLPGHTDDGSKEGLLPGFSESTELQRSVALTSNLQNRYEDRWITLEAVTDNCVFFRRGDVIYCPVAHAEGRLVCSDATLARMAAADQIALRYLAPDRSRPVPFPHNPNGSTDDIAGITDPTGRILGLMPHPERNQFAWQDPRFHRRTAPRKPDGLKPFINAMKHLKSTFS